MTLTEFRSRYPEASCVRLRNRFNSLQVFTKRLSFAGLWELHHLSDYVVSSSVSGPSVILSPRNPITAKEA